MSTVRLLIASVAIGVLLGAGCGSDEEGGAPADCTRIEGGEVTLVARNLQWNTDCLRTEAGTEVTFTVQLEDEDVKHDLEVFGNGIERVKTPLEAGPTTQTLSVDLPRPGRYQYLCTIHAQMEGDLFADEPPR